MSRSLVACRWLVGVLALLTLPHALGVIEHLSVRDDTRSAFHIDSFGFEPGGMFYMQLNDFERYASDSSGSMPKKDVYEIAFVLQRSSSDAPARISGSASTADSARTKIVRRVTTASLTNASSDSVSIGVFPMLDECFHTQQHGEDDIILQLEARSRWQHMTYEHPIEKPGFYHLYFSNCEPMTSVSMELEIVQYNVDADGTKMYLSAGERYLPTLLVALAALFGVELVVWLFYLRRHTEYVRSIHWLMLVCVITKILSVGLEAIKYQSLKMHGMHNAWFVASYVVGVLRSMSLCVIIVLLATGWSLLKPYLTERDRHILLATILVQAFVNAAAVVVSEVQQGDRNWITAHELLIGLDMLCWLLILLPIAWSMRSLRAAATDEVQKSEHASAGRSMNRLQAFRSFYLLVIAYIYTARVVAFLLALMLPFELVWISSTFVECATLVFYGATGYLFRPASANPYRPLEPDGEEEEEDGGEEEEDGVEFDESTEMRVIREEEERELEELSGTTHQVKIAMRTSEPEPDAGGGGFEIRITSPQQE